MDDATIYLQKFIHIQTKLPKFNYFDNESNDPESDHIEHVKAHLKSLLDDHGFKYGTEFNPQASPTSEISIDSLAKLCGPTRLNLSPRQIEQCFIYTSLIAASSNFIQAKEKIPFIILVCAIKSSNRSSPSRSDRDKTMRTMYDYFISRHYTFDGSNAYTKNLKEFLAWSGHKYPSDHTKICFKSICQMLDVYLIWNTYTHALPGVSSIE
ncbi:MAG: hypothetical protein JKX85_09735 [Phycisphaeraceae bacterium]|nr:hypothetical protein [Phycisphaeraceae bacterium]